LPTLQLLNVPCLKLLIPLLAVSNSMKIFTLPMLNCAANVVDIFRCNLRPVSQFLQQDKNRRINFVDDPLLFVIRSKPPPHNKQENGQKVQLYRDKVETSLLPDTLYQLDQPYFVRQPPTFT